MIEHDSLIRKLAYGVGFSHALCDPEDLYQAGALEVIKAFPNLPVDHPNVGAWVNVVARSGMYSALSKHSGLTRLPIVGLEARGGAPSTENGFVDVELELSIAALPDDQRIVVERYLEGASFDALTNEFGWTARETLREAAGVVLDAQAEKLHYSGQSNITVECDRHGVTKADAWYANGKLKKRCLACQRERVKERRERKRRQRA